MPNNSRQGMNAAIIVFALSLVFNHAQGSQEREGEREESEEMRRCAWQLNNVGQTTLINHVDEDVEDDQASEERGVQDGQMYVKCSKASNACYSLWHVDYSGNSSGVNVFTSQGCWEVSGTETCDRPTCDAKTKPPKALNNTKFCCCSGDFCNANVTDMYKPDSEQVKAVVDTPYVRRPGYDPSLVIMLAAILLLVLGSTVVVAYRLYTRRSKHNKPPADHQVHLMEGGTQESYSVEHLKLDNVVGQGRYGSVWRGNVRDQEVAVKIFPSHYRNYFLNERDIYCLPYMDNPALLTYFGCDERTNMEGNKEYLLVLTYAPNGCLQDYLRNNTLDCATFCKMALGVARGLAHLHTDIKKGDKSKPCVSHRDLNTRNILVKNDLSCCLCDLGFAMKIAGSKYYHNGEEQHAETKSINDVGTLRYMAPEVLEGAVNLRDCESSLKQIDVYALGLVLWELASRCADFYPGGILQTPPYNLPFQAEVGHHPSFEQMQVLVSRHKARPLFPEVWKDWTAIKLLKETVEDCWDQDAEARLTALCVEERLQELPLLWERKRALLYVCGVSPTVNTMPARTTLHNTTENNLLIENEDTAGSLVKDIQESTASEGTVETLLTLTPSEPPEQPTYKISNHTAGGNYRPLSASLQQPYQGRNPCLERNLMTVPHSDSDVSNPGVLIDRSFKHVTPHAQSHFNVPAVNDVQTLVTHDQYLNQHGTRSATPIPYVQNVSTMPKQPNVPGNGSTKVRNGSRWSWGVGIKKLFERRRLFLGRTDDGVNNCDESKSNLLTATSPTILDTCVSLETKNGVHIETGAIRPRTLPLVTRPHDRLEMRSSSRQSLDEQFFNTSSSTSRLLKDINCRVKTPGDVPIALRKERGKRTAERLSLYDDRMMSSSNFSVEAPKSRIETSADGHVVDKDSSSF